MEAVRHFVKLFRKQGAFFEDKGAFVAAVTGVGGGKSYVGALKALEYVVKNPGSLGMVTAPSYKILTDASLASVRAVWPEGMTKGFHSSEMKLEVPNGSGVLFRSTDDPNLLRGVNLAWVWMDEAAQSSEESFRVLQGRLRQAGYPHQLWITTTPFGYNWVYQEFVVKEREHYRLHHWSARENHYLPGWDEEKQEHVVGGFIKNLEESYTKEFAMQEIEGEFTVVGGDMYFRLGSLKEMLDVLGVLEVVAPGVVEKGGLVTRWRKAVVGGRYVMGLDTAWGKTGSYSCGHVASFETMEEVARVHGRPDLDELAQVVYGLHREYNRAYILAEWAGDEDEGQYVVRKLEELGCGPWMYYRDGNGAREKPGFVTDGTTRPWVLANLEEAVRNKRIIPRSKGDIMEMMSFVRDKNGRPGAVEGMKDDGVMSWAFTWEARGHAVFGDFERVVVRSHLR